MIELYEEITYSNSCKTESARIRSKHLLSIEVHYRKDFILHLGLPTTALIAYHIIETRKGITYSWSKEQHISSNDIRFEYMCNWVLPKVNQQREFKGLEPIQYNYQQLQKVIK